MSTALHSTSFRSTTSATTGSAATTRGAGMTSGARTTRRNVERPAAARSHLRLVEPSEARPQVARRSHLRITRRGRVVLATVVTLAVLVTLGVIAILGGTGATASSAPADVSFQHITVQPGETLWDIAEGLDSSADPRDVIVAIEQLNDLPTSDITAGESLAIPLEYASSSTK